MVKIWNQSLWCKILEIGVILTLGVAIAFPKEKTLAQNTTSTPPKQFPIPERPPQLPIPTPQPLPQPPLEISPPNLPQTYASSRHEQI